MGGLSSPLGCPPPSPCWSGREGATPCLFRRCPLPSWLPPPLPSPPSSLASPSPLHPGCLGRLPSLVGWRWVGWPTSPPPPHPERLGGLHFPFLIPSFWLGGLHFPFLLAVSSSLFGWTVLLRLFVWSVPLPPSRLDGLPSLVDWRGGSPLVVWGVSPPFLVDRPTLKGEGHSPTQKKRKKRKKRKTEKTKEKRNN